MKNLIATADDYGIFPAINNGVIDAINAKKINSVSVLSNYDGNGIYPSAKKNIELLLNKTSGNIADLGCHLTVTSGKPLTGDKMNFACDKNGYFLSFDNFKNFKEASQLAALKEELVQQVKRMQEVTGCQVKHLTNHHNSLTLFPHHIKIYMEVAKQLGVPMRSTNILPKSRQNIYIQFLNAKLIGDVVRSERNEMKAFAKDVNQYFSKNSNGVKSPSDLDSRHYGPIPVLGTQSNLIQKVVIKEKRKKLDDFFNVFNSDNRTNSELLLHLYKNESDKINEYKDLDYPGVDRNYFDSRSLEFKSIMEYDQSQWNQIKLKGWDLL
jgi:predicted glycoside hydrolase/deacetylase ChbG (UPF0249 family)